MEFERQKVLREEESLDKFAKEPQDVCPDKLVESSGEYQHAYEDVDMSSSEEHLIEPQDAYEARIIESSKE